MSPKELMDAHLFAEYREIRHVPAALKRILASKTSGGISNVLKKIPKDFTLNTGHVCFFFNKGAYLRKRFEALREELLKRGYNIPKDVAFDAEEVYVTHKLLNNDYEPDAKAYAIIRQRIAEKIAMKPSFYKYYGKPIKEN